MKVLLDHCVPAHFGLLLQSHEVRTTFQEGWEELRNGALLRAAGGIFGCFVTVDKGIRHQQNLRALPIAVIQIVAVNNQLESLTPLAPRVLALLDAGVSRALYLVSENDTIQVSE